MENKLASSLVVSLSKALNGTPIPLCGIQVTQTPQKRQFLSKWGRPIQNIAIQFAFSSVENKNGQYNAKIQSNTEIFDLFKYVGQDITSRE